MQSEHHTIDIHQHSALPTILAKFRIDESRTVATPMAMKLQKRKPNKEACDPTIYQLMIGSLMYPMTTTRPNIAFRIRVLSRFNHNPSNDHKVALESLFQYLNSMKDWRLISGGTLGGALEGESAPSCYEDSD
jgi:hypothetical protein